MNKIHSDVSASLIRSFSVFNSGKNWKLVGFSRFVHEVFHPRNTDSAALDFLFFFHTWQQNLAPLTDFISELGFFLKGVEK